MTPEARPTTPGGPISRRTRFGWLGEVAAGLAIYFGYDTLRTEVAGSTRLAYQHARQIVSAERFLHIYWERDIQRAFLHLDWFIAFWNIYYGTIHFVMPVIALVWLYLRFPARYVRWRNTLALMFGLAVLTFWAYPLMPPRVMPPRYGFVDTAAEYYNFGPQVRVRFDRHDQPTHEAEQQFGNLYAAMPSFHVGWSTWFVFALWPVVRRRWVKVLLIIYPLTILFCITVTANHWLLDAVGGWAVLGIGYLGACSIDALTGRTRRAALVEQ
ncbi:MAG TPA: phosphatase PAP2 family protein [Acidimicrobiia bacterium]|nr:phosphatase PAP2 family protein [Acidimicrobiia bacterium]